MSVTAHKDAIDKVNILHCDISLLNLLAIQNGSNCHLDFLDALSLEIRERWGDPRQNLGQTTTQDTLEGRGRG